MNALRQAIDTASARRGGWQPAPVHEKQAQASASLLSSRAEPNAVAPALAPKAAGENVPGGKTLAPGVRSQIENRLGADFSHVRIHADSEAGETVDTMGARALAVGSDIAFAPGEFNPSSAQGRGLLAHELTHTLQQAQAGAPAVQMQGREQTSGLGNHAPKDDFSTSTKFGDEDGFALFDLNQATLVPADQAKMARAAAQHKGPVTLIIHGYASEEGDANYNVNLAAWRAAAIKQFLAPKLPPGSKVVLYSNGRTDNFGPAEQNRRAGFAIKDGIIDTNIVVATESLEKDAGAGKLGSAPFGLDLTKGAPRKPEWTHPKSSLFLPGITPGPDPTPAPQFLTPPAALAPPVGIDWSSITPKFTLRGLTPDSRDYDAITSHWNYSYNFFLGLTHNPALSAKGANLAVPFAYDKLLSLQNPNAMDSAQREFETLHGGITTYNIPISSILDGVLQHIFKTDRSFTSF
jgi:outer membrane protein OmpA-like peptidoglycan-associated protein